ncbi:dTDP-4-dehydrorhamnose 3,5-epimerase family protein [Leptospira noguchii]|uniref:dTDP-4-dehydrorhamnose 3,5-epimerase n=1 Tax=Leptospira noguchii TaxID=28182 RepID=A0A9Q8RMY3_9LEPT|nr:dTDP-4-dehydrorhamnose 3,5-epimerase family protein [Leptospira noguchii]TQE83112.1 dTDP-4-dehydrorhamnose 3,5-epimerase [Leptospira noguchii]UOG29236.1 dTDP-4-dehydrorhamnose 3,5-epimerase family protein [Leptospira noguchii]UOG35419.1 dTDP-4-dehydrorhamnose 3,5-epimerase family protein [Leptospira noguchii]UOG46337.1 dTDP-4-dehydrorhamnose 3,5-epimerase family protein [Leptospira noguchii]UOG54033.1 dTDP-4-dehydrorhamnose 3,5-epimerase family protein [Leptospira noguchii]
MNEVLLEGVVITSLKEIFDPKGSVLHMIRADDPEYNGFGECYFSEINPGFVKAWKFHKKQTQNFTVPFGKIRLILFDSRENSKTKGKIQEIILGRPENYQRVTIPPQIWYGFTCISKEKAFIANFTDVPHDPTESERLPEHNSFIPFTWSQ